jgi:dihydroorotate dehydrogenase (fumarate)
MLSTKYMGIELKNPLIAGSCGLTNSIENIIEIEKAGAGAIVIKSIFEEQIQFETQQLLNKDHTWKNTYDKIISEKEYFHDEAFAYMENYAKENTLANYLDYLKKAKQAVKIPIIASVNCTTAYDWQYFSKKIQDTGVDGLELNIFVLPSDFDKTSDEIEQSYFNIISEVKKYVTIPIALKTGFYFSGLAHTLEKIAKETGISAMVLFNRSFNPDIDLDKLEITANKVFSSPDEYFHTLRWVAIMSGKIDIDIAAATGIHDSSAAVKQILAGASAVQITSAMYKKGFSVFSEILTGMNTFITKHNYSSIKDFKGKMCQSNIINPAAFERVQFIKTFSSIV